MTDKVLIDSNILVYAYEGPSNNEKHLKSLNLVSGKELDENSFVSIQNLAEFSRVLSEKIKNLDLKKIMFAIIQTKDSFNTVYYTEETILEALSISKLYKIHFFDALLAATMKENGIKIIITENDSDFKKIPWIKAVNPFK